jgi:UDP-glucose 4-epimerase
MTASASPVKEFDKIVLLGARGFIGSRLAHLMALRHPGLPTVQLGSGEVDLSCAASAARLADFLGGRSLLVVCSGLKKQLGDNLNNFSLNLRMAENLCAVLQKHPVRRLVYFSSAEVYGAAGSASPISEKTPENPSTFYGIAKSASERLLRAVCAGPEKGSLLLLRPPLVYGAGDSSRSYGPSGFCWSALSGEKIRLWGDGSELREFLFIDDLAEAVCRLMFLDFSGTLNLATGVSHSFREALEIIGSLTGRAPEIEQRPRSGGQSDSRFSNELLRRLLPDFSFTSLRDGIAATLDGARRLSAGNSQTGAKL